MDHGFERDVAVVGAGRIGLPWAAVLAAKHGLSVTCIDVDETVVDQVSDGTAPFEEPGLDEYLGRAVRGGDLVATSDQDVVENHRYVAFTMNAPRNQMSEFLDAVEGYAGSLTGDHVVVNRTTLPVHVIEPMRRVVEDHADGSPSFVVFPERLAEGKAIQEIENLVKVVGATDEAAERAIRDLLEPFDCPVRVTDHRTAMFVKLIDNGYRDAIFAIANQIAFTADQLGLDGHEAIALANADYPRNDIPAPGTVGGKCLPKDPHFLTDEVVCDQPTTPDLFNATRRTNASLQSYIATEILRKKPSTVTVLGLAYKRDVSDTAHSPAIQISEILEDHGVETVGYDPHTTAGTDDVGAAVAAGDVILLAVSHTAFDGLEATINEHAQPHATVYDVWNTLDPQELDVAYDGFGLDGSGD